MNYLIPRGESYLFCRIEGSDFFSFAQRIFTRDLRNLKPGTGLLTLLLAADAKVKEMFWLVRCEENAWLCLFPETSKESFAPALEAYRFSEDFRISAPQPVSVGYRVKVQEDVEHSFGSLRSPSLFIANFRQIIFEFHLDSAPDLELAPNWQLDRIRSYIPELQRDFFEEHLVFEWGLEDLCDPSKGCYVGQEIVERVKSRGGSAASRLVVTRWSERPQPGDQLLVDGKTVGTLSRCVLKASDSEFYAFAFVRKGIDAQTRLLSASNQILGQTLGDKI